MVKVWLSSKTCLIHMKTVYESISRHIFNPFKASAIYFQKKRPSCDKSWTSTSRVCFKAVNFHFTLCIIWLSFPQMILGDCCNSLLIYKSAADRFRTELAKSNCFMTGSDAMVSSLSKYKPIGVVEKRFEHHRNWISMSYSTKHRLCLSKDQHRSNKTKFKINIYIYLHIQQTCLLAVFAIKNYIFQS